MANTPVRQYIGARYVPLFADPAEWDNQRTYEPLTIVIHEGNSYTSRQYVPAGIDLNNNAYWALTGNYNAQVEAYRKEVAQYDTRITEVQTQATTNKQDIATLNTRITEAQTQATTNKQDIATLNTTIQTIQNTTVQTVENTPIVFIGDSTTQGYGATKPATDRWTTKICNYFHAEQHNYAVGGSGFTVNGQAENGRFDLQAQTAANDTRFDHTKVRLIFISGGVNDNKTAPDTTAKTNAKICLTTLRNAFPNAKIIAIIGVSGNLEYGKHALGNIGIINRILFYRDMIRYMQQQNCATIDGWRLISTNITMQADDRVHPNTNGYAYIAGQILNTLLGGAITYEDSNYVWDLTSYSSNDSTLNVQCQQNTITLQGRLNYTFKETDTGYGTQNGTATLITLPKFMQFIKAIYIPNTVYTNSYFYSSIGYLQCRVNSDHIPVLEAIAHFNTNITTSTSIQTLVNCTLPLYGI